MTSPRLRHVRLGAAAVGLLTITLVPGLTQLPALAGPSTATAGTVTTVAKPGLADSVHTLGDAVSGLTNLDVRGTVEPTLRQLRAARSLGSVDLRWNDFGSPASILPEDGALASGYSTAPAQAPVAARAWLSAHHALFGLSRTQVAQLDLVNNQKFAQSPARAVLFRQDFGSLTPALDSMVTVGVARGEIAYVSSSITRSTNRPAAPRLSPVAGWVKAAADVGRTLSRPELAKISSTVRNGFTRLTVPGFATEQQARLRSLAMADGTVVPVVEANVVDVQGGLATAYTLMVDAVTGKILNRQNRVENSSDAYQFQGSYSTVACGPKHPFALTDDATRSIVGTAAAANTANDIVVKIFKPSGALLTTGDTATSPEAATYAGAALPRGTYSIQVCPFDNTGLPPFNYAATVNTSNSGTPSADTTGRPRWRYFPSNPQLGSLGSKKPTNSQVVCWYAPADGCNYQFGPQRNVQAVGPWDTAVNGSPTLTTVGNNANTHEAWASPLTPGGTFQAPVSPTRQYTQAFTDAWNNSKCNPAQLRPGGNDINASVTDLFVAHNVMHDYAYYLGFTEANYNLQTSNFGRGGTEGDSETGNAQAGALSAGSPTFMGRDNANQIALQDGVPGITNQYLFQPIAGAFYAPCTDGSLDFGIVGHEYTHAISNRMVGGPDEGLTSFHGRSMGESWSDLNAAEYQFNHGLTNGGNIWAVGVYATQNKDVAIRDYAINKNPLNFSDYGFDSTGPEVHADGEIWNGTQWSVRQAMVDKYDKRFPYRNKLLQLACNTTPNGYTTPRPLTECPGNRRWIQMIYDAWLLQQGATSMLDARDAMLASNRMRFGGRDVDIMWKAFAQRGMGRGAKISNAEDTDPRPSFENPRGRNGIVTFRSRQFGKVYVGRYEARSTPIADTSPKSKALDSTAKFAPGTYQMLFVSERGGAQRFTMRVAPGKRVLAITPRRNLASKFNGAKLLGATAGSRNAIALIDSTEKTNWGGVTEQNVDASHPFVTVDLSGTVSTVRRVQVSAALRPGTGGSGLPIIGARATDPDSGSRFTALRRFALEACVKSCSSSKAVWRRFYTSSPKAFPAALPRPVAPDLIMRSFKVPATKAAAIRFVVLENQCTGNSQYAGEQDNDPTNATDCKSASDRGTIVHAAELQVFER